MSYKLLINTKQWKDCKNQTEKDVLYIAKTLSKYSHCRVDVYQFIGTNSLLICYFLNGQVRRGGKVA